MLTEGQKERIKLRANFSNGIGLAFFAVGGLAPTIALVSKQHDKLSIYNGLLILMAGLVGGSLFHFRGIVILGEIDKQPDISRVRLEIAILTAIVVILAIVAYLLAHW